jgi:hypothetical protein
VPLFLKYNADGNVDSKISMNALKSLQSSASKLSYKISVSEIWFVSTIRDDVGNDHLSQLYISKWSRYLKFWIFYLM